MPIIPDSVTKKARWKRLLGVWFADDDSKSARLATSSIGNYTERKMAMESPTLGGGMQSVYSHAAAWLCPENY
jgi:hypothetical protein